VGSGMMTIEEKVYNVIKERCEAPSNKYGIGAWDHHIKIVYELAKEYAEEYDGIKLEAVNFRSIKKPAEWNKKAKEFINTNINKLSKHALDRFLKDINDMFCEE
jgi:hypothetical protein